MKNIIYALKDPRTLQVRYIGKSSRGLIRPRAHAARLSKDPSHKANWIRELVCLGLNYDIEVLEEVEGAGDLDAAEIRWIAHGRSMRWPLTNLTSGGDGPTEPRPPEVIAKIRAACRRPEAIAKMRAANLGRKQTDEHRKNASLARIGKKPTPTARANMAAAQRGRKHTPEDIEKTRQAKIGKPRPDFAAWHKTADGMAHADRMRKLAIGRPRPDLAERNGSNEQRAAVSRALTGRVFSAETIERMKLGQQRRRAKMKSALTENIPK